MRALAALSTLAAVLASSGCETQSEREAKAGPPNIVLIVADDLGWTDTGAYGSGFYETPHIDRLAREGIRFMSAYAAPNCAPTRAALLTGRYSPRTGIYTVGSGARGLEEFRAMIPAENVTNLALSEVVFAEPIKAAGYRTAHMGKWHMGTGEFAPENQGFDLNVGGNDTGSPKGGYFAPWDNPQLEPGTEREHLADRLADRAVEFIQAEDERPFLLYLPFYSVHTPIQAKEDLEAKYRDKAPAGGHSNATYAAMIETMDTAIGRVLAALDEAGVADHTVVMFTSDNGGLGGYEAAGVDNRIEVTTNAPLRGGKGMLYEGGIRVPLIVRWPGVSPPGATCLEPVAAVDYFPTLMEIARAERPSLDSIDGRSFTNLIRNARGEEPRPAIYWHFPGYLEGRAETGSWRTTPGGAILEGNFKLIEFFETGQLELYDLEEDIGEKVNLAQVNPEKMQELYGKLVAWRAETNAPMPTRK